VIGAPGRAARVLIGAIFALALAAMAAGCGGQGGQPPDGGQRSTEPRHVELPATPSPAEGEVRSTMPALEYKEVDLYFPSAFHGYLVTEPREIFDTTSPGDRAKQILSDLLEGPNDPASIAALPRGVLLRQVYVTSGGVAYADFSSDLKYAVRGGSMDEILAVFAIVNSLVLNIEEIDRVGILVDGQECETLAGHMDLRRPLAADLQVVAPASRARLEEH
jgi:hypothetical protein